MKTVIKLLLGVMVLAVLGWGAYVWLQPKDEISYITQEVKRGRISQTVSATGEITSSNLVNVGAQASGQIKKMYVKIGDVVQKGDLLAEIDRTTKMNVLNAEKARLTSYQAQLESAQVALRSAQRKHDRYAALQREDAVSKEELDNVSDNLAAARARIKELQSAIEQTRISINTAQTDIGYTRIVAPISGTIVAVMADEGQTVNANQTTPNIVQIANLELMLNKMQIAEGDATKVRAGQQVRFTILSEPDVPITTVIESVDPGLISMSQGSYSKSTDTTSSAIYYYARAVVSNADGKLAIGMTTQNTVEIASVEDALLVPTVAVKSRGAERFVRVLTEDGQNVEKVVTVGLKDSMNTEIKSGLNEGEQVILSEMSSVEQSEKINKTRTGPGPAGPRM